MVRFMRFLCWSSLVASLLPCVRVDMKGVLMKDELEVVDPATAAEAEAEAQDVLAKKELATGAKTKASEDTEEAEVADAAKSPRYLPWRLARRLSRSIADMAFGAEVHPLAQGGALIVAESASAPPEDSKAADAAEAAGIQPGRLARRLSGAVADMAFAREVYPLAQAGAFIVAENAAAATEDVKGADAAEAPGIQPRRLARRLSGAIADMAFAGQVYPLAQAGAFIAVEKPTASVEEAIHPSAAKGSGDFKEATKSVQSAQTSHG